MNRGIVPSLFVVIVPVDELPPVRADQCVAAVPSVLLS
jgi:hypothetical protein